LNEFNDYRFCTNILFSIPTVPQCSSASGFRRPTRLGWTLDFVLLFALGLQATLFLANGGAVLNTARLQQMVAEDAEGGGVEHVVDFLVDGGGSWWLRMRCRTRRGLFSTA
jgi:hypothetical protein